MPMLEPPHPGGLVRDNIEALGLSIAVAAEKLGITRQQLHRIVSGRSAITPDFALRLEQGIGGSAQTWLRMQVSYDLARARKRPDAPAIQRILPA